MSDSFGGNIEKVDIGSIIAKAEADAKKEIEETMRWRVLAALRDKPITFGALVELVQKFPALRDMQLSEVFPRGKEKNRTPPEVTPDEKAKVLNVVKHSPKKTWSFGEVQESLTDMDKGKVTAALRQLFNEKVLVAQSRGGYPKFKLASH